MSEVTGQGGNSLIILTEFLTNNIGWVSFIVFIIFYKQGLSNLLTRITGLNFSNGESKLGLDAAPPSNIEVIHQESEEATIESKHQEQLEIVRNDTEIEDWFSIVNKHLENNNVDKAKKAFKAYELEEEDQDKLYEDKGLFLFLVYSKANDLTVIPLLEKHINESINEKQRYSALIWLSFCFNNSKQFNRNIELWLNEISNFKSEEVKINATEQLARAYSTNSDFEEAKQVLIKKLSTIKNNKQKSSFYSTLARVEEELGNKTISAYCLDKAVEYNPENLDELFNSAYNASEAGVHELAISNYSLLTDMNPKNSTAWNNLGVEAKEIGLKAKSVENYIKAAALNETLAMANEGYALLNAGFIDEAESKVKKALECSDIHNNIHSLMSKISSVKKEEEKKWIEIQKTASQKQRKLRKYIEKYYLGVSDSFHGEWFIKNGDKVTLCFDNEIKISWEQTLGISRNKTNFTITGLITGGTFKGQYKSESVEQANTTILGIVGNLNVDCLGYVDGNEVHIFSLGKDKDISIELHKKKI
ncbi:hypothetical protein GNP80_20495 [Aliivibrio fischeri]|uniref:tetratricopeptide repeat protein n=1 Tax=Aliivibrio fischeri TaxID=668 RepID=UPI0012DAA22B|nr:tetratricopeptide repeat protein [Aliivibrio fischeri]MUK94789.1 hypothetical protein [Aliivibrio fischeri]